MLTAFATFNVLKPDSGVTIFKAINLSMLPLFLLANLLTGGVNLAIDTLAMGDWAARGVVAAYALTLCCAACLLTRHQRPLQTATEQRDEAS